MAVSQNNAAKSEAVDYSKYADKAGICRKDGPG
jgi:hypothetical protein